jgi:hypothetical protein
MSLSEKERNELVPGAIMDNMTKEEMEVFFNTIGRVMYSALPSSMHLGHAHPQSTIRDYQRVDESDSRGERLAVEFAIDFFKLNGNDLCLKWFGEYIDADWEISPRFGAFQKAIWKNK